MKYDRVPRELKKLKQWVCAWDHAKIPMRIDTTKAASSADPETWGSFAAAAEAVKRGSYDHIGFVFNDNDIVGIDIDTGFEDGLMTPLCADIMKACGSYTERSKSGRGVHIFVKGDLPFTGRNNLNGVEIYQSKRFFIMTGNVLIFDKIIDNQAGIDYVVNKYFSPEEKEKSTQTSSGLQRIYTPQYRKPEGNKVFLRPVYPEIESGGRNISLTSLAGALHSTGYDKQQIYRELCFVNNTACKPPLPEWEVESICNSITKYRRR